MAHDFNSFNSLLPSAADTNKNEGANFYLTSDNSKSNLELVSTPKNFGKAIVVDDVDCSNADVDKEDISFGKK